MTRLLESIGAILLFPLFLLALSLVPDTLGGEPAEGRALFEARCITCHGRDAKGSVEAAKRLKVDPIKVDLTKEQVTRKSAASLRKLVAGGHGKMPRQDSLSPAQIRSLVKYLQSLQRSYAAKP
jgi:mono/diheme cytochrome c family protein